MGGPGQLINEKSADMPKPPGRTVAHHRVPDGFGNDETETWPAGDSETILGRGIPEMYDQGTTSGTSPTSDGPVKFHRRRELVWFGKHLVDLGCQAF